MNKISTVIICIIILIGSIALVDLTGEGAWSLLILGIIPIYLNDNNDNIVNN